MLIKTTISIDDETLARLQAKADAEDVTVNSLVRQAIRLHELLMDVSSGYKIVTKDTGAPVILITTSGLIGLDRKPTDGH